VNLGWPVAPLIIRDVEAIVMSMMPFLSLNLHSQSTEGLMHISFYRRWDAWVASKPTVPMH